jgi:hypothetical protein
MGGQQSRLRTNSSNNDGENKVVVTSRIDKFNDTENAKNCWSFSNCHKLNERSRNENDVYKPLHHEPLILSHSRAPLASVESASLSTTKAPFTAASTATTTKQAISPTSLPSSSPSSPKLEEKSMERNSNSTPSFVAGVVANTWKTGSVKRPENLPNLKQHNHGKHNEYDHRETSSQMVQSPQSTTSLYSDISSIRTSDVSPEYSLSEHSHDMLMHILHCFPFPSPKNSPRVVKRMDSKSSLPGCQTEPSSSHEYIEGGSASLPLKKKHHFTKHNPVANFKNYFHYHHHNNNEKRGRAESSVSEVVVSSSTTKNACNNNNTQDCIPTSPTGNRPYALSTTSAPDSALNSNEHENNAKKSALSRLCQVSFHILRFYKILFWTQNEKFKLLKKNLWYWNCLK